MKKLTYTVQMLKNWWTNLTSNKTLEIEAGDVRVFLSRNQLQCEVLVFQFKGKFQEAIKASRGFSLEILRNDQFTTLRIGNKSSEPSEMFYLFVANLLNLNSDSKNMPLYVRYKALVSRIKAWQHFMKSENYAFSAEQELGLFGELVILEKLLNKGYEKELLTSLWTGPLRESRDFKLSSDWALEVKTSTADDPFVAKISSLKQLDNSDFPNLFLVAVKLIETEKGLNLIQAIERIKKKLNDDYLVTEFESLLVAVGFLPNKILRPLKQFSEDYVKVFNVESLPRLLTSTVKGVVRARYEIELFGNGEQDLYPCSKFDDVLDKFFNEKSLL